MAHSLFAKGPNIFTSLRGRWIYGGRYKYQAFNWSKITQFGKFYCNGYIEKAIGSNGIFIVAIYLAGEWRDGTSLRGGKNSAGAEAGMYRLPATHGGISSGISN